MLSLFGHEPLARPSVIMKCPGLRPALPRGRTQCVPPRKPPLASSPGFRREAIPPWTAHPGEGRAPHARIGRHRLDRGMCAVGQPASCLIIGWKWNASARVRPCHADAQSASLRENRPQRHPRALHREAILGRMADSAEGRAPHAREERTGLTETCALLATGLSSTHPVGMECPGLRPALRHGRTECVPPRRRPSASSPGLHPLGKPRWGRPRRGGAGSARPQCRHHANPNVVSFGPRTFSSPVRNHEMPRLAPGLATRTHGVRPSEKTARCLISGFSPRGHPTLDSPPRGGAGSARRLLPVFSAQATLPLPSIGP